MTGPGAVMPLAPSLPSRSEAKLANAADAAGIDAPKFGAFSELFSAINGETEAPAEREQDADLPRDESAGVMPPPIPIFPEKTPQTRFAEGLTATLPPEFVQGNFAFMPPAVEAETPMKAGAAAISPIVPPSAGRLPAQPPVSSEAAEQISSALPDATPEPMPATPSGPPVSAPAIPLRGQQERNAAKPLLQDGSAAGEPTAATTMAADPLAAPAKPAAPENRSGQDGGRGDPTRALAAQKEAKVSVVLQETHFAPAPQQSPAFQIANRIIQDVETGDPVFTAQLAELPKDAGAAPLKVLHIQLDPPELGALTIRMSLRNDMLHMQIEASRHETAKLIERDQDGLSGMLRSAGYSIDGLTVQVTSGDRGSNAQQFSGGGGFNPSAGQHSAERQAEDSDRRRALQGDAAPARIVENGREPETPGASGRRGGPVYL